MKGNSSKNNSNPNSKQQGQTSSAQQIKDNQPIQQSPLKCFSYFIPKSGQKFGLEKKPIYTSHQVLFSDLQLMIINGFIDPTFWTETFERKIEEKLRGLKINNVQLKDLYFSDVKEIKLSMMSKNYEEQQNQDIFAELKQFGQKIREKYQHQKNNNNDNNKFTTQQLLNYAIQVYNKINLKVTYKDQLNEEIQKRYVIDLILMQPQQSYGINTSQFTCQNEEQISQITYKYLELIKNLQISGVFIQEFILGNDFEEILNQYNYFTAFQPMLVQEQIELLLKDKKSFKINALDYQNQQLLNHKSYGQVIILEAIQMKLEEQQQFIASSEFDKKIFTWINNMKNEILKFANDYFSQTQKELETIIADTIESIWQSSQIWKDDYDFLNFKFIPLKEIATQIANQIYKDLKCIPENQLFKKGEFLYDFVESKLIQSIFVQFKKLFLDFFSVSQTEQINGGELNLISNLQFNNLLQQIQLKEIPIHFGIIKLFQDLQTFFEEKCLITNDQFKQPIIKNYPKTIQIYLLSKFEDENELIAEVRNFEPDLSFYLDSLKEFIKKEKELFQFKQQALQNLLENILDEQISQIYSELLQNFIPFVNMQEYMNSEIFTSLQKKKIKTLHEIIHRASNQFQQYELYIDSRLQQFNKFTFIWEQKQQISEFRQTLLDSLRISMIQDFSGFSSSDNYEFVPLKKQEQLNAQISIFFAKMIPLQLQRQVELIQFNKNKEYQLLEQKFDKYFLPFQCISVIVKDFIWQKMKKEKDMYFNDLNSFFSNFQQMIQQRMKPIKQFYGFELTKQTRENLENHIQQYMIAKYKCLDIYSINVNELIEEIIQEAIKVCKFSEQILLQKIKESRKELINLYLNEIFEITKDQCHQILTSNITIDKVEQDQFQDQMELLLQMPNQSFNIGELQIEIFQFFRMQILDTVLKLYEDQIANHLNLSNKIY